MTKKAKSQNIDATVDTNLVDNEALNAELDNNFDATFEGFEDDENAVAMEVDFTNIEYLKNNEPIFPAEHTSKKYKAAREPKVQLGLKAVRQLLPNMSENFILMCMWWENKTARTEIKKLLDAEAESKNIDPVSYLQRDIRKDVDLLASIREAIDRMAYACTYFKPRTEQKDVFRMMKIRGELYNVNLRILDELKAEYGNDKEALLDAACEVFNKISAVEEL